MSSNLIQDLSMQALNLRDLGVVFIDESYEIVYHNSWVSQYLKDSNPILGKPFFSCFTEMQGSQIDKIIQSYFMGDFTQNQSTMDLKGEFPFYTNNGQGKLIHQRVAIHSLLNKSKRYVYIEIQDVSELYVREQELENQALHLERLANYDTLTGLMNRRFFTERLTEEISSSERNSLRFAVLFLDLDHFKQVNDKLGHSAGDELLRKVSGQLKLILRRNDIVARLGGDEFVILLDNITREDQPAMVANKLLDLFRAKWTIHGQDIEIGTSIGISIYPNDGTTASELLNTSDMAMYTSKQLGRGRFQYYSSSMGESAAQRAALEQELKLAVEEGQFELYFQPQVDIHQCKIHGCEALIRWNHPTRGLVMPMEFISLAEESLLIVTIGRWVIEEASRFLKRLNDSGLQDVLMAINLSPRQFEALSLFDVLSKAISEAQINAKNLVLEITEGHLFQSKAKTNLTMKRLKNLGIQIALDDFGTGYSSLAYLKTLPLDFLKIDRLFVTDLVQDLVDQQIISSIIELAQGLNLDIVAEGAETPEQVAKLKTLGCGVIQGFYYAEPLSGDDFIEYCLQFQG